MAAETAPPSATPFCGAMKQLTDFQNQDYAMKFLMGLNDFYSHIRGQILLLEPLPSITEVFSLIVQEERQREISSGDSHSNEVAAFFTRTQNFANRQMNRSVTSSQRKDKPVCSHCGLTGHTVDKCYKLHRYPPGYKFKNKPQTPFISANHATSENSNVPQPPFTMEQCQ